MVLIDHFGDRPWHGNTRRCVTGQKSGDDCKGVSQEILYMYWRADLIYPLLLMTFVCIYYTAV